MALLAGCFSLSAHATTLTVPDQVPTIQVAIDAVVDTIFVRSGVYPETLRTRQPFRLLAASADAATLPVIAALVIDGSPSGSFEFRRLEFSAGVVSNWPSCVSFRNCRLDGGATLNIGVSAEVDSCQVTGGISAHSGDLFSVRSNTFQGTDPCGVSAEDSRVCFVEGNTIRGFRAGIALHCDTVRVADNFIENCYGWGVYDESHQTAIANNVIRGCAQGIQAQSGRLSIVGNTVSRATGTGVFILSAVTELIGNIVWGCGQYGIAYSGASPVRVRNNTVCLNGYGGIDVDNGGTTADVCVGNIGYGNGYGLYWDGLPGSAFACNDWFGNLFVEIVDRPPSESEFSVDPQFCDPQNGDFHLRSDSPLLDWTGCGLVGALGLGCAPTATLVRRFTAERVNDGVRVVWEVAEGASASEIRVERSEATHGEAWSRPLMEQSMDGRAVVELDRSAALDRAYRYRLVANEGGDMTVLDAGVLVPAGTRMEFGLREVGPSPGNGPVRIAFSVARVAAIEIEVFDVQGRKVASPGRGVWPAGTHVVVWDGRTRSGEPASAGMYVVRYVYPGGEDQRRVVQVR